MKSETMLTPIFILRVATSREELIGPCIECGRFKVHLVTVHPLKINRPANTRLPCLIDLNFDAVPWPFPLTVNRLILPPITNNTQVHYDVDRMRREASYTNNDHL